MIHLAVTAGLRVSELVALRLDEVSFQSRYVDIHVRGKGRKDRILSLWKEVSDSCALGWPSAVLFRLPNFFLNARGNRMTRAGFEYLATFKNTIWTHSVDHIQRTSEDPAFLPIRSAAEKTLFQRRQHSPAAAINSHGQFNRSIRRVADSIHQCDEQP